MTPDPSAAEILRRHRIADQKRIAARRLAELTGEEEPEQTSFCLWLVIFLSVSALIGCGVWGIFYLCNL